MTLRSERWGVAQEKDVPKQSSSDERGGIFTVLTVDDDDRPGSSEGGAERSYPDMENGAKTRGGNLSPAARCASTRQGWLLARDEEPVCPVNRS